MRVASLQAVFEPLCTNLIRHAVFLMPLRVFQSRKLRATAVASDDLGLAGTNLLPACFLAFVPSVIVLHILRLEAGTVVVLFPMKQSIGALAGWDWPAAVGFPALIEPCVCHAVRNWCCLSLGSSLLHLHLFGFQQLFCFFHQQTFLQWFIWFHYHYASWSHGLCSQA